MRDEVNSSLITTRCNYHASFIASANELTKYRKLCSKSASKNAERYSKSDTVSRVSMAFRDELANPNRQGTSD